MVVATNINVDSIRSKFHTRTNRNTCAGSSELWQKVFNVNYWYRGWHDHHFSLSLLHNVFVGSLVTYGNHWECTVSNNGEPIENLLELLRTVGIAKNYRVPVDNHQELFRTTGKFLRIHTTNNLWKLLGTFQELLELPAGKPTGNWELGTAENQLGTWQELLGTNLESNWEAAWNPPTGNLPGTWEPTQNQTGNLLETTGSWKFCRSGCKPTVNYQDPLETGNLPGTTGNQLGTGQELLETNQPGTHLPGTTGNQLEPAGTTGNLLATAENQLATCQKLLWTC